MRSTVWLVAVVLSACGGTKLSDEGDDGSESGSTEETGEAGDDHPGSFDERGVWSLQRFALDGINWIEVDLSTRENAFLLRFSRDVGVVAGATCIGAGSGDVQSSLCRQAFESWECRCFSYVFEEANEMRWEEFSPGATPPADPTHVVAVAPDPTVNGAILTQPLPGPSDVHAESGLFNSDGNTSRHNFLPKAESVFDETQCSAACGI
jgi:hypothetical protein